MEVEVNDLRRLVSVHDGLFGLRKYLWAGFESICMVDGDVLQSHVPQMTQT